MYFFVERVWDLEGWLQDWLQDCSETRGDYYTTLVSMIRSRGRESTDTTSQVQYTSHWPLSLSNGLPECNPCPGCASLLIALYIRHQTASNQQLKVHSILTISPLLVGSRCHTDSVWWWNLTKVFQAIIILNSQIWPMILALGLFNESATSSLLRKFIFVLSGTEAGEEDTLQPVQSHTSTPNINILRKLTEIFHIILHQAGWPGHNTLYCDKIDNITRLRLHAQIICYFHILSWLTDRGHNYIPAGG